MVYNFLNGDVVLVKDRNTSIPFHYTKVEDPENPGSPFSSVDDLWAFLSGVIGGGGIPSFTTIKNGYLYNGFITFNANFVPAGWHIPTTPEIATLSTTVGGDSTAGRELKESGTTYWNDDLGTNTYLFNMRGSGYIDDQFRNLKVFGGFWVDEQFGSAANTCSFNTAQNNLNYSFNIYNYSHGISVRLIKNDDTLVDSLTDYDGNVYPVVKIGSQVWMAANWKCTHLNDGTPIYRETNPTNWFGLGSGAYCAYNNTESNV